MCPGRLVATSLRLDSPFRCRVYRRAQSPVTTDRAFIYGSTKNTIFWFGFVHLQCNPKNIGDGEYVLIAAP